MKKVYSSGVLIAVIGIISAIFLSGCRTHCEQTRRYITQIPVFASLDAIRTSFEVLNPQTLKEPGKVLIVGNKLLIVDVLAGVHVYDNSNPSSPTPLNFLKIQTCVNIEVKDNILYANQGPDIISVDISDIGNATITDRRSAAIYSNLIKSDSFVVDFTRGEVVEVIDDCSGRNGFFQDDIVEPGIVRIEGTNELTGDQPRFTITHNHLITVDRFNMALFDISTPATPRFLEQRSASQLVRSVFIKDGAMFVGGESGLFRFNLMNGSPERQASFVHHIGCADVAVQKNVGFVAIEENTGCITFQNEIQIMDFFNSPSPRFVAIHEMNEPGGIVVNDSVLFVADGSAGLRVFSTASLEEIPKNELFRDRSVIAQDIILIDDRAIVIADSGVVQYDISNPNQPVKLSEILKG